MTKISETLADLAWKGYDGRALLPLVAAAGAVSILWLVARWMVQDLSEFAERIGSLVLLAPVLVMWSLVFAFGFYRCITYTYRLTNRALLVDRGFRWPPIPPMPLTEIADVTVVHSLVGRWFDIGTVRVRSASGRTLEMIGIHAPARFVHEIRKAANQAQSAADGPNPA